MSLRDRADAALTEYELTGDEARHAQQQDMLRRSRVKINQTLGLELDGQYSGVDVTFTGRATRWFTFDLDDLRVNVREQWICGQWQITIHVLRFTDHELLDVKDLIDLGRLIRLNGDKLSVRKHASPA